MQKRWIIVNRVESAREILPAILQNRGVSRGVETEQFLAPAQKVSANEAVCLANQLFDPKELAKAVDLIQETTVHQKPVVIHGDYDVDGIASTAILWETIYHDLAYKNIHPFIPHRINHGYGLSRESINAVVQLCNKRGGCPGDCTLVAVDCGITAKKAIEHARSLGFRVIIIDHHELPETSLLPNADAILHSTKSCAAALTWLFSQVLLNNKNPGGKLDLAALGIIADLQPLLGLNRRLAQLGLCQLNQTQRIGLQALYQTAGIQNRPIGPYEVGFIIGPRLNAMGRLEHAAESLRLLCTRNPGQAEKLAGELNRVNTQRQQLTEQALQLAQKSAAQQLIASNRQFLVLDHTDWHEGIIGLIANKLVEEYRRPAIAISRGQTYSKGSARSVNSVNVIEELRKVERLFVGLGGHAAAAGFTIETRRIKELKKQLESLELSGLTKEKLSPALKIDLELPLGWIDFPLIQELKKLEPHGIGNPRPIFLTRSLEIADLRAVGADNQHLKLLLKSSGGPQIQSPSPTSHMSFPSLPAIGFGMGDRVNELSVGDKIDLVYSLQEDTYNGPGRLQLKLKDLRTN